MNIVRAEEQAKLEAKQDPSWSPQKAAEEMVLKKIRKCGDAYFTKRYDVGGYPLGVYEFKNLSVQIKASPLTDADKLNGIEWKGTVFLVAKASRAFQVPDKLGARKPQWLDWENGAMIDHQNISGSLAKRKGRWALELGNAFILDLKPIECSEIPSDR